MINDYADIPLQTIEKKGSTLLFSLLENRDEETFRELCAENRDRLDELHEKHRSTCLQLACQKGLPKAVQALLKNGADPNKNYHLDLYSPIMMAGLKGYYEIVEMLAQHNKVCHKTTKRGTVLHTVLEGISKARERFDSSIVMEKGINCLKVLLKKRPWIPNSLDINAQNEDGFTALNLAFRLKEKRIILLLLEHGAYIGSRCSQGYTFISSMKANVFEECLNNCIRTGGEQSNCSKYYEIIYDYSLLIPPGIYIGKPKVGQYSYNLVSQTDPLIEISRAPKLRHLLKHPLLASFLHMKWYTLKKYYWINFTFYLTFWLFLTLHSLALHSPFDREKELVVWWIQYPSIVLCGSLSLREFFKLSVSPTQYVSNWENFLNIALLISNILVLCDKVDAGVAAIALLLTWIKMVLLINRHPLLSSNFEMYKAVCTSFLKLLAWWSILIVAFALSFSLLFKDKEHPLCTRNNANMENNICMQKKEDYSKFFNHIMTTFFKVIIMITGEFDTNSIPLNRYPGVSHVIFISFVFLVSIVLFNLMIGLAVSDTQAIRNETKVVGYVTLAKQILSIETMLINCLKMLDSLLSRVTSNPIRKRRVTAILSPYLPSHGFIFPNQSSSVITSNPYPGGPSLIQVYDMYTSWWIPPEIVNKTKEIVQKRESKREDNEHSSNSLNEYSEKLEKCSEKLETYSEKLEQYGRRLTLLEETTNEKLNKVIERVTLSEETTNEKLNTVIKLLRQRN